MSKKNIIAGLMAVIILQIIVLGSEYLGAVYPLWTGTEIKLKTVPVDPRSLFRGNYARLEYDISSIEAGYFEDDKSIRENEVVYVKLKPAGEGLFEFQDAGFEKPDAGIFIKGRIVRDRFSKRDKKYNIKYGIEAFFAPKEKALALEKKLRRGGAAVIMVAENGKAALKNVEAGP